MNKEKFTLIGAGLTGPLLATYLAQQGYSVEIFERRPDMRKESISAGRSINLALSARGNHALKEVGLYDKIKPNTIPMKGRMIHDLNGNTHLQPYGQKENEVIFSVSRAQLNMDLMTLAEETGKVTIRFNHQLLSADLEQNKLLFQLSDSLEEIELPFNRVIGCDGSASILRKSIVEKANIQYVKKPLGHGYKELTIPPLESGKFRIEPNALHIWPRGNHMLIALPNNDFSFTCTLFFPMTGATSFETVKTEKDILDLFQSQFHDAIKLIPNLVEDFQKNSTGDLASVYCKPWHLGDKALLIGDAAHAVVPFFGQGMNASFQDCSTLAKLMGQNKNDWKTIFNTFSSVQVENGHAIADMAIENYLEMRDHVNDTEYKKRRNVELKLERMFPGQFIPRYSMVSFHQIPYAEVYQRGGKQFKIIGDVLKADPSGQSIDKVMVEKMLP
ncbi:MAG: NAD(P)/FAD-dependent oxidoreductase [Candidatus Marinimicrobia bacterium]|nr:NAD(P)/FAD-dependent oxidoreductase [Candidatus Neomarinimicrobiota bacterium]